MDINIVVLYIMCFSLVIFFTVAMGRQKKEHNDDFRYTHRRIDNLANDIERIHKILKIK